MIKQAQHLALADHNADEDSSESEGEDDSDSGQKRRRNSTALKAKDLAKLEMAKLKMQFDKSPLGCLYRFGKFLF